MRPRNVLTQTNDMRRLMGLPLLNEDKGDSIRDIKKKVLNENSPAGFSLGMARHGGLSISEEEVTETTESEDFRDEGVGKEPLNKEFDEPINEIERAQKMAEEREARTKKNKFPMEDNVMQEQDPDFGEGPLGIETGIDVGSPQAGDGEGGLGEPADDQVFAEGDFAKYNVTESWFDKDEDGEFLHKDEYSNDGIKKDVRRIISFLTPGEGDEIEGRYMDNIYPAMALQTAEILYGKL